jgi:hypothetical protein
VEGLRCAWAAGLPRIALSNPISIWRETNNDSYASNHVGSAEDNQPVHIVVTDRGSARQREDIIQLLGNENVDIVWANLKDVFRIWGDIQTGKEIDGPLLTSWGNQYRYDARMLDDRFLGNLLLRRGSRSVPTLAMGESMFELLRICGGERYGMHCIDDEENHPVDLVSGSHLQTWAGVDRIQVTGGCDLASIDIPRHSGIVVNARADDWLPRPEGFETVEIPLQVGTLFDPAELALRAPTEATPHAAKNILHGFVAEPSEHPPGRSGTPENFSLIWEILTLTCFPPSRQRAFFRAFAL